MKRPPEVKDKKWFLRWNYHKSNRSEVFVVINHLKKHPTVCFIIEFCHNSPRLTVIVRFCNPYLNIRPYFSPLLYIFAFITHTNYYNSWNWLSNDIDILDIYPIRSSILVCFWFFEISAVLKCFCRNNIIIVCSKQ